MYIDFDIKADVEGYVSMLRGVENGFYRATRDAANAAASEIAKNAYSKISGKNGRYDIDTQKAKNESHVSVRKITSGGSPDGKVASVSFTGANIPVTKFNGWLPSYNKRDPDRQIRVLMLINGTAKWRTINAGTPAKYHILNGNSNTEFKSISGVKPGRFVAEMKSGHLGIWEREAATEKGGVSKLRQVYATSVPGMIGQENVREELEEIAGTKYIETMNASVVSLLNGSWKEYAGKHNSTSGRLQNVARTKPTRRRR